MTEDPLAPLTRLRELFQAATEEIGARVIDFSVRPGHPHEVVVILDLDDDLFRTVEDKEMVDVFDQIAAGERELEIERQASQSKQGLEKLEETLRDPSKGLLDD